MIRYTLRCTAAAHGTAPHEFDSWFKDSDGFDKLTAAGMVQCPACGGSKIARALMAPAIPKKGRPARNAKPEALPPAPVPEAPQAAAAGPMPPQVMALLQRIRAEVEKSCDYVGQDFAEEARKMSRGESERRGIYGEASESQAEELREEGIEVGRIPWVPRSDA
ncbi:DUF1178 family protein [Roseomonas hellenica]|uniref:DUF1178 family protein n=1 Tax=Plastoroseomonas hellenica TaxID=2687306 RepID=A0ABS5ESV2_9PROT|nr:DUF1178 family protein [Plastoroseomonas hellenica]MBR0663374.1 DUF1178 family protein [Plastoroseomonas hellenica]